MNEKLKEIIGKHKPDFDEEVKNFKARTLIKLIDQEELLEIFKLIIDEYESENSSDNESDNTMDPIIELKPDDVDFDYDSATTQRMTILTSDLAGTLIGPIKYNTITYELSIVFKTYNSTKYDSLINRIKHIMSEDNTEYAPDVQHRINIVIKSSCSLKYKVRISEAKCYTTDDDAHCIDMKFNKCQ